MNAWDRAVRAGLIMVIALAVLWIVQFVNVGDQYLLEPEFGLRPHVMGSVPDMLSAPLLHASWAHIESNSVPFLVLGFLAAFRRLRRFAIVSVIVILTSSLAWWLTGPTGGYEVGASGVIFGWMGYVLARGVFNRRLLDVMIAAGVSVLHYGTFALLPPTPGLAWQAHLGGFMGGVACAWMLYRRTSAAPQIATGAGVS